MFEPIINSILDNDFYKFTQQKAVLEYNPNTKVIYKFYDRKNKDFNKTIFFDELDFNIKNMSQLQLTNVEYDFLLKTSPFLGEGYLNYLKNFRYNPNNVIIWVDNNKLKIDIKGTWVETILWEIPILSLISELYYKHFDKPQNPDVLQERSDYVVEELKDFTFAEFGTRRRFSKDYQELIIDKCRKNKNFVGTSNVYFAQKYNLKSIGTQAHEWIMGISALESLRHANRYSMKIWSDIYKGNLGIALTDTFGTLSFLNDFNVHFAKLFDGVRHDSGCPFNFGNMIIKHYEKLNIDPKSKTIVFSDAINYQKAKKIYDYFQGKIKFSFGIGTYLTNSIPNIEPMNIVIKMHECNKIPVVKISDDKGKEVGDAKAIDVAKWTFNF